jgi:hypothetical protein
MKTIMMKNNNIIMIVVARMQTNHNLLARRKIFTTTIPFTYFYNAIAETKNCVVGSSTLVGFL